MVAKKPRKKRPVWPKPPSGKRSFTTWLTDEHIHELWVIGEGRANRGIERLLERERARVQAQAQATMQREAMAIE